MVGMQDILHQYKILENSHEFKVSIEFLQDLE